MATIPSPPPSPSRVLGAEAQIDYPTGDSRPVGETPLHFKNLANSVQVLERHFASAPMVYVSGNMFVYYEKGNRRKHVSPDVFVAVGVPKDKPRDAYFTWEEAHGLDFVIELTSKSTQEEDLDDKLEIYRDEIQVPEYFLFDPKGEYLDPPLQGYVLRGGEYVRLEMLEGRLPSEVLGLQLERDDVWLRFYNSATGLWLPTPEEREAELEAESERAAAERERAETERERAEAERERLATELRSSNKELERLRQELEEWRRRHGKQS